MKTNTIYINRQLNGIKLFYISFFIRKAALKTLKEENISNSIVSAMLTDDEGIREYNKKFRAIDKVTDVLSFPNGETDMDTGKIFLGDILINIKRCKEQSIEFGHSYKHEIMYLTVHSVLHLLGYDHVDEGEMKRIMREREKKIMEDLAVD